jgi:hypothetical protein
VPTYEKEYIAILLAVEYWRSYLQFQEFCIVTDHKSLLHLDDQRLHTSWQQKVFTKLLGLNYKIVYKKGVENKVADALSRKPSVEVLLESSDCYSLSVCQPKWLEQVLQSYDQDEYAKGLIAKLHVDNTVVPNVSLKNGLLCYKNRIWVGSDEPLQLQSLAAYHNSVIGGHSGVSITYRRMKQFVAWKGMKSAVQKYVQSCLTCQQSKPDRSRYLGFLQPLPTPDSAW